jgi:hypothetical protein
MKISLTYTAANADEFRALVREFGNGIAASVSPSVPTSSKRIATERENELRAKWEAVKGGRFRPFKYLACDSLTQLERWDSGEDIERSASEARAIAKGNGNPLDALPASETLPEDDGESFV